MSLAVIGLLFLPYDKICCTRKVQKTTSDIDNIGETKLEEVIVEEKAAEPASDASLPTTTESPDTPALKSDDVFDMPATTDEQQQAVQSV